MRHLLTSGLLALLIAGCGDTGTPSVSRVTVDAPGSQAGPQEPAALKVAVVLKSLTNPFFVEMARGARMAQQEAGNDLQIKATMPETSVEQQIRIVEDQIKLRVQAIVISPVDTRRLVPALKAAQDAGIKVVNIDERLHPDALAANGMAPPPFIGVDNEQGAYRAAKFIADQIRQPTEVLLIEGAAGTRTSADRRAGAERALRENPRLRIVASGAANWKADEARALAQRLFALHPRAGVVICGNDLMAMGVIEHLRTSGKTGVRVGGYDALDEAKGAIRAGQLTATVDQRAAEQGYLGVVTALKLLRGEAVAPQQLIETGLVTAGNLR